jgi:ubiquinone/menaquinone biosynthesis C-methylase UbiE
MQMSFTGERYVPELRGQIYYEHFHRYAMVLELARDKDVLDIACGEGYGTAALALVAKTAVGVDLDPESVHHAAVRYTGMNVAFRAGDCTQIPAADASFDLVVSFETIEHLAEQERMLVELRRVLRPDGLLVISSPNKLVYSDARGVKNPFHKRELYFHEFRDMLRSFFPMVRMFGQRIFAASAVHPLRGAADETRWLGPSVVAEGALGALPDPEYFVAICGRSEDSTLPDLCSVYLDPRDELLADIRAGGLGTALSGGSVEGDGLQQLSSGEAELAKIEHELAERVVQVKSLEDHAGGLESLLHVEQRRSGELEERLESLSGEFTTIRESADQLEATRRQENVFFAARVAELERQTAELEQRSAELEQRNDEAGRRSAGLEQRNDELERRSAGLEQRNDELERRNAELERQKDELEQARRRSDSERDNALAELAAAVEARTRTDRKAAGLMLECDALREALSEQQGRTDEAQRVVETAALADAHREIARLELERLNYDELAQRTHAAETLLADIMGSHSWRLTLPARRFMGALRKRGNS